MTQLSDTINRVVQEALTKDGFEPRILAPKVWEELDDESRAQCGIAEIIRRMKQSAKSLTQNAFASVGSAQIEMPFRLDGAVAIDIDDRKIRLTESLQQAEFRRAIDIRRKQIKDDEAALQEWIVAERMATPYWAKHPKWTFGQCVTAISRDMRAKARKSKVIEPEPA